MRSSWPKIVRAISLMDLFADNMSQLDTEQLQDVPTEVIAYMDADDVDFVVKTSRYFTVSNTIGWIIWWWIFFLMWVYSIHITPTFYSIDVFMHNWSRMPLLMWALFWVVWWHILLSVILSLFNFIEYYIWTKEWLIRFKRNWKKSEWDRKTFYRARSVWDNENGSVYLDIRQNTFIKMP